MLSPMKTVVYRRTLALVVTLCASAPVFAVATEVSTDISSGTISLRQVMEFVQRDNPEILAAHKRWESAQKRITQAATPDKPRLDIERMYAPVGRGVINGAPEKNLAVTQEIPFPTTLYLQRSRAAKEAEIAEQAYQAKIRDVTARARSAYAMLFLSYRSLEIFEENIEIMRRFSKVAESKYAAGHSTQLDALKAQVELTKMLNMSVELEQEKQINRSMLNALLNREAQAALGAPTDPDPGTLNLKLDELQATALARRPELRAAFLSAERAGTSLSIARSSYLPDLMLQYRWRNDPMRGNSNDAVLGFSLPLWFWKPAAMVAEAKADKEMSEADLQAMKVDTSAELATAWLRTQTAKRLADIYRTSVLPQTNEALKVAEAGYQSDRSSFLDLLDVQRSLLNFRLEYYRYLAEYEQRLAELERIAGKELSPL
jgi:cobalt-zinc-cadmium efflux system outer membrane protein